MLQLIVVLFILALISAVVGFSGLAGTFSWVAQMLTLVFVVLIIVRAVQGNFKL